MSAEYRTWENMTPVGREFGSPDYERLMQEDAYKIRAKLGELVHAIRMDTGVAPEASEFKEDTINVQKALKDLGHDVNLDSPARLWKLHSSSLLAGWMSEAQSVASTRTPILSYCVSGAIKK